MDRESVAMLVAERLPVARQSASPDLCRRHHVNLTGDGAEIRRFVEKVAGMAACGVPFARLPIPDSSGGENYEFYGVIVRVMPDYDIAADRNCIRLDAALALK